VTALVQLEASMCRGPS